MNNREKLKVSIISLYETRKRLQKANLSIVFLLVLLLIILVSSKTLGQEAIIEPVQNTIVFDGLLTDSDGNTFKDGTYTIVFSLYKKNSDSKPIWKEIHNNIKLVNGVVNLELGKDIENPINVPFDDSYYIGIKLGEEELLPRQQFTSVPYSLRTKIAAEVPDNSITTDKIANNSITNEKIKSIDWSKITGTANLNLNPNTNPVLPNFWRRHGNYLETGNEFLGTLNDRNLVIKVNGIQRMIFEPYGRVVIGTLQDSVHFEVIGLTTLCDAYFRGKVGVGVYPGAAQLHIDSPGVAPFAGQTPFQVDSANTEVFKIEKDGRVSITSSLEGEEDDIANYPFFIEGEDHGIAINIHGSGLSSGKANSDNYYISFWDTPSGSPSGNMTGRIEGQTALEYVADPLNIAHAAVFAAKVTAEAVAIAVTAASAASTAGVKWNEAEDIIKLGAEIIYEAALLSIDMINLGVTYESGSGDYAEWLQRANINEVINPGDIVGIYAGKISKKTINANRIMSVSLSPIILGNMPPKGMEQYYEKIAFKGQVPVNIIGVVNKGDYIIPSGNEDGTGIAISPELVTIDELIKTVGIAWQESDNPFTKMIKVGVGLNMHNVTEIIKQNAFIDKKLETKLEDKNSELKELLVEIENSNSEYEEVYNKMIQIKEAIKVFQENKNSQFINTTSSEILNKN